ncbi:HAD family hydrolase [Bacillus sp. JCM 19041]|uniref:HAD family hydrolase n=1 Tax=Bacillus sp. JCM 19041 TaxID=1460637 RepID=UPI0006D0F9FB
MEKWKQASRFYFQQFVEKKISFTDQKIRRIEAIFNKGFSEREALKRFKVYIIGYEKSWTSFNDARPSIKQLIQKTKIGIISNGEREQQIRKLKAIGLFSFIDTLVTSDETGCSKPAKELFLHACEKAKVEPAITYYVGDRITVDVYGSQNAGMKALWLNRKNLPAPEGVKTITSLYECCEMMINQ